MSTSGSWNTILQNCWYIGNNFNAILYGIELVLYFTTVKLLLDRRARHDLSKSRFRVILGLSTGLLCMITVYLFAQNFFGQEMWIINSDYAGGSGQYYADHAAVWYQTMGSAASVVMNWMSDAYFIYRVYVIWQRRRRVIIVPCVLYVGTVVLGILTCYYSGRPGGDFFVGIAPRIAMAYSAVGIVMNFMCTALISGRILYASRGFANVLKSGALEVINTSGCRSSDKLFQKVALMIIESMLPYTLFGVAYVVSLALISPVSILFLSLYVMFTCLSPQMIMLCVAMGREWRDERTAASRETTSMQFVSPAKLRADLGFSVETYELPDLERDVDASRPAYSSHASSSTHA